MTILDQITFSPRTCAIYDSETGVEIAKEATHCSRHVFILDDIVIKFEKLSPFSNNGWEEVARWVNGGNLERNHLAPILEARVVDGGTSDFIATVHPRLIDELSREVGWQTEISDEIYYDWLDQASEIYKMLGIGDCHAGNWFVVKFWGGERVVIVDYEYNKISDAMVRHAKDTLSLMNGILTNLLPDDYEAWMDYPSRTL